MPAPSTNAQVTTANAFLALKKSMRSAVIGGLYHLGAVRLARDLAHKNSLDGFLSSRMRLRSYQRGKLAILCYHRIGTEGVPYYSRLEPRTFAAQMRYLKSNYRLVALSQLLQELQEDKPVPPTLALTFDDGYRDLYDYAFPVLRKYQIPATVYLVGRCVQTGETLWYDRIFSAVQQIELPALDSGLDGLPQFTLTSESSRLEAAWQIICVLKALPEVERLRAVRDFERRFPPAMKDLHERMLNWQQIHEMSQAGIEFGAHTMTHPAVARLTQAELHDELQRSKEILENGFNAPVVDFAYPFGKSSDWSPAARDFLIRSGYRSAVTTAEGYNSYGADLFELRRLQIGNGDSISAFAFEIARMFLCSSELETSRRTARTAESVPAAIDENVESRHA